MAIIEISGIVSGVSYATANISGKFNLAGAVVGKGSLTYGAKPRVLMDVDGFVGEMPYTDVEGVWSPIDAGTIQDGQIPVWDEAGKRFVYESLGASSVPTTIRDAWVPLIIGDGTNVIGTGLYPGPFYLPEGTIRSVKLWGKEASGSVNVDVWADLFANVPPTVADSITSGDNLIISAARKVEKDAAQLATDGWITAVPAGGYFGYLNIVSISTFTQLFLLIQVRR